MNGLRARVRMMCPELCTWTAIGDSLSRGTRCGDASPGVALGNGRCLEYQIISPPRPRAAGPRVLDSRLGPSYPPFRDGKSCFRVRDRRFRAERKKKIPINKPPSQHFSRLRMSSEYVARRIVDLARHPRRSLVLPWFYRPIFWLEFLFPGLLDGVLAAAFSRQSK